MFLERLRNALNRGMNQEFDIRRTSKELTEAVPQTDILGKFQVLVKMQLVMQFSGTP